MTSPHQDSNQRVVFIATSDISVVSHLDGLSGHLAAHGIDVTLIASDSGLLAGAARRNGCQSVSVAMEREPSPLKDLLSLVRMFIVLRTIRPDAVVYGTPKAALIGAIASWLCRVPRRVLVIHGLRIETLSGPRRALQWLFDRLSSALSSEVLAVGNGVAHKAWSLRVVSRLPQVLGAGSAQGIDLARFSATEERHSREHFTLGFVGRITADKGIDSLVSAFVRLENEGRNIRLQLVGDAEGWSTLQSATRLELERNTRIEMLGAVNQPEIVMKGFDALCLPTRREGLPTILLEGAAMGIPVVATRATGVEDIVSDDVAHLVEVDDTDSLVGAIAGVMDDSLGSRTMALNAQRDVRRRFSNAVVWHNWLEFMRPSGAMGAHRRVLWLSKGLDQGGAETLLLAMAENTELDQFELHVGVSLDRHLGLAERFSKAGVVIHRLGGRRTLDLRWVAALWRLVRSGDFQVVHAHSPLPAVVSRLAVKSMRRRTRPRMLTTEHAMKALYSPATRVANRLTLGLDDMRFAVSSAVSKSHGTRNAAQVLLHAPARARPLPRSASREQLGIPGDACVVMTIANFRPEKNLALLVKSFTEISAAYPDAYLVLIGEGEESSAIRSLVDASSVHERIRLPGRVEAASRLLSAADIAVLCSDTEGMPVFVMECLQQGVPVIATNVGGVGELISPENGILVPRQDQSALAQAMSSLLISRPLRDALAEGAALDGHNLSLERCCEAHVRAYESAMATHVG